jgi:phage terminase large subunit-like protein
MAELEAPPAAAWWGDGPAPTERWPGVTIPLNDAGGRFTFDAAKADRVCTFFPRYCSHSKGDFAGKPFELLDYQRDLILRPLFGWVDASGRRRFRKAYIQIPKKQGKTQLIAGLAIYMLLGDNEPGAEVYVAASDRDQARILFDAAKAMVEANPYLRKRCVVYRNEIRRADDPNAFFKVLSAEAATKHGPNIHCLIIDELHAQPDRELVETLTRGVIARRQPLTLFITTAGDDDESICFEEYDYAKRVLSGTIEDRSHLPVIFEATRDEDPFEEQTWRRVNPGLGHTIRLEALAGFALEAKNEPRKLNDFLRFHLNRWVNQATAWLPLDWWDRCVAALAADAELSALPVTAGLDLAQKIDLACLTLVFRHRLEAAPLAVDVTAVDESGNAIKATLQLNYRITLLPFFWIPENTMRQHEKDDGVPYSEWARLGLVTPTEGDIIDYDRIYQDITTKIVPRFERLKQGGIGYDPAFATDIASSLRDKAGFKVEEILQNYKYMSEPCHVFEALVKSQRVTHAGHRVLRNHIENVAVKRDDAGRIRPVKPKRASKRIDGVVSSLMGLRMLAAVSDQASEGPQMFFVGASR